MERRPTASEIEKPVTATVCAINAPTLDELDIVMVQTAYSAALARSPLAQTSRLAYRNRINGFLRWLERHPEHGAAALQEPLAREHAVRDYLRHLRVGLQRPPTTCNAALAAINHFGLWLGLGPSTSKAVVLPKAAPRALEEGDVRRLLRAAERRGSVRDQAILVTLFATGLRLSEVTALDLDDVNLSARKGIVTVKDGKGGRYRQVPLNSQAREALQAWLDQRGPNTGSGSAVFIGPAGKRLTDRAVDLVLRRIATDAGVPFSAHVARHTAATKLVRDGVDIVLVAEVLGHANLETTRRYSLPSEADRATALERLVIEA